MVTESVFAWPGMGKLIIDSINVLDRPVIVAYLMMIVLLFVVINLVVDVLYTVLDPRVRLETQGMSGSATPPTAREEHRASRRAVPSRAAVGEIVRGSRIAADFVAESRRRACSAASSCSCSSSLAAIFAPLISPQNPYDLAQLDMMDGRLPPGSASGAGNTYWLGTDDQGRDMLSAILYGLRISLGVGVGSRAASRCVIGIALGLLAAYAGGRTDALIMRLVDIQLRFPSILVALMMLAMLGKGVMNVVLALVIVQWAYYARTVRSAALVERAKEYIEAARLPRAAAARASCSATCCRTACRR